MKFDLRIKKKLRQKKLAQSPSEMSTRGKVFHGYKILISDRKTDKLKALELSEEIKDNTKYAKKHKNKRIWKYIFSVNREQRTVNREQLQGQ